LLSRSLADWEPKTMSTQVLSLNAGSSSIKFSLFALSTELRCLLSGKIERIGSDQGRLVVHRINGSDRIDRSIEARDFTLAGASLLDWLDDQGAFASVAAIGHRIVHSGGLDDRSQRITQALIESLRRIGPLDPDHMPQELALIEAVRARDPERIQVACFDTAFHRNLPPVARRLGLPRQYEVEGLRRYGFHGISYSFLMEELARVEGIAASQGRLILAHLGAGASLAAVRDGICIDTTMAFTPTAGLLMATRCGDIDPGALLHLLRRDGVDADQLDMIVNRRSGLLGISETSGDMRDLLEREAADLRCAEAVESFCYQTRKWIGAYAAALGGLDTLVFSGGIGENASEVRRRICDGLEFLGVRLDSQRNSRNDVAISDASSRVAVRVIRTDEERMIAEIVVRLLGLQTS
jgi:acetate kinase